MRKYKIGAGGIVEIICSALVILCMFLPWQSMSLASGDIFFDAYSRTVIVSMFDYGNDNAYMGAIIYGIIGLCLLNIFLKFYRRSRWLSVIVVLAAAAAVYFSTLSRNDLQADGIKIDFLVGYHLTIVSIIGLLIGILLPTDNIEAPTEKVNEQSVTSSVPEEIANMPNQPSEEGNKKANMLRTRYLIIFGIAAIAIICFLMLREPSTHGADEGIAIDSLEYVEEIGCNVSEENEDISNIDDYFVTGDGEGGFLLYAKSGDITALTELDYSGNAGVNIYYKGDIDGDGNMDCIVVWYTGGNCEDCAGTDLVYYDKNKGFRKIKNIKYTQMDDWKGKPSIVHYGPLTMQRFILENGELKEVEKKTYNPGIVAHTYTREELFPVADENSEDVEVEYDLDGDGQNERIVFCHSSSLATNFGETMSIQDINWTSNLSPEEYIGLEPGKSFSILEHTTNDVHDILIDDAIYRWDGSRYWRMRYDGKELLWEKD